MDREEYIIKLQHAIHGEIVNCKLFTEEYLHAENGNIVWNVELNFSGEDFRVEAEYFLSVAIDKIRAVIEPLGYLFLIRCADYDAGHSGMQADMTAGASIFKLDLLAQLRNTSSEVNPIIGASFHVLDESAREDVATLERQAQFRKEYAEKSKDK